MEFPRDEGSHYRYYPFEEHVPINCHDRRKVAGAPEWSAAMHHEVVTYRAHSKASLTVKAYSETPRRVIVNFWPINDRGHPFYYKSIDFDTSAMEYVMELPESENDLDLIPGINLGSQSGSMRIDEFILKGFEIHKLNVDDKYFVEYRMNNWGYRDRDWSMECPPNVLRIACVGDSFTYGQGVKDGDLFSRVIESNLNNTKPQSDKKVESMNFGMCGYSTEEELEVLRVDAIKFSPRIVVLTMCSNDSISIAEEINLDKEYNRMQHPDKYNKALSKMIKTKGFKGCIETVLKMNDFCKEHHCQLVVGIFNVSGGWEWDELVADVLPAMREHHIPAFDIGQEAKAADCFDLTGIVHPSDWHPNEKAHAIYAKKLVEVLQAEVLPNLR